MVRVKRKLTNDETDSPGGTGMYGALLLSISYVRESTQGVGWLGYSIVAKRLRREIRTLCGYIKNRRGRHIAPTLPAPPD